MIDVLCVGHAAWDVIVRVPALPAEDTKAEATGLAESGGGPAANAAYLLALWGARCGFAGLVGDDEAGRRISHEFQRIGVDTAGLELRPGHATPISIVLVSERTGSRTVVTRKAPTDSFNLAPLTGSPRVLLFDGHELAASLQAMDRYPDATTILDAGSLREGTLVLAKRVDHLVASERFARQVTGLPALELEADRASAIAALHATSGRPVVVTLGSRGLVHGTSDGVEHLPPFPVRTIDTTAAGDIFHGAFAFGLLTGLSMREALRLASMAAALSVEVSGGQSSVPTLDRTREALNHAG